MKPCSYDSYPYYKQLIGPLREVSRRLGYALTVHGSLVRDIDLVAVPWSDGAVSAKILAKAIQHKAREIVGYAEPHPVESTSTNPKWFRDGLNGYVRKMGRITAKPHGRKSWTFHLLRTHDGPYIDLAVMSRVIYSSARRPLSERTWSEGCNLIFSLMNSNTSASLSNRVLDVGPFPLISIGRSAS